ncbi:D-proline reductase (dithiol) PrdB [Salisediminibacterium halotolerans]|uniref:D-proline reductase (Dithiol) PrdB n=2 Tax=Salisediminibacterium halotolerans TaxID=517425 RepID=A0A1H9RA28_9BACI|nr:D-proline reductase (dithiol) PrdB [Actinophytocola xinjiangensis]RPE88372.1 D-proline reductase (dithiol) PrdB [Salisediminibacterium halotolerans]SER69584.1 D-proline reductase (dithiol) PrdB [Salisediminibacterium haloalkalitolerans]
MLANLKHRLYRTMARFTVKKTTSSSGFTVLKKPQQDWNVAILTTAGVHLRSQEPFDVDAGDPTVRFIPGDTEDADLMVTHTHYDTTDADEDINTVFPLSVLREFEAGGEIGRVAADHFGMMGYIPETEKLENETIPKIIERLKRNKTDVLLLSPG